VTAGLGILWYMQYIGLSVAYESVQEIAASIGEQLLLACGAKDKGVPAPLNMPRWCYDSSPALDYAYRRKGRSASMENFPSSICTMTIHAISSKSSVMQRKGSYMILQ